MNGKLVSIFTVAGVLAAGSAAYAINNRSLAGHAASNVGVATADLSTNAIVSSDKHSARPIQQTTQAPSPQATSGSVTPANTSAPIAQASSQPLLSPTHSRFPAPQASQPDHSAAQPTAFPTPVPTASTPAGFPTPPPGFTPGQGGDDDGGNDDGDHGGHGGFHHDDDN